MRPFLLFLLAWGLAGVPGFAAPLLEPPPGSPEGPVVWGKGTRVVGLGGGASLGTRAYGGTVAHDLAAARVNYAVVTSDLLAEDRFWRGRVLLAGDFLFARQYHPDSAVLFGATPLVRYVFETGGRWRPFVDAGSGFALTDIGGPSLGGKLQFSPQAAVGVYWLLKPDFGLSAEHRFVHYSNASLRSPNVGINQHMFLLGLVRWH